MRERVFVILLLVFMASLSVTVVVNPVTAVSPSSQYFPWQVASDSGASYYWPSGPSMSWSYAYADKNTMEQWVYMEADWGSSTTAHGALYYYFTTNEPIDKVGLRVSVTKLSYFLKHEPFFSGFAEVGVDAYIHRGADKDHITTRSVWTASLYSDIFNGMGTKPVDLYAQTWTKQGQKTSSMPAGQYVLEIDFAGGANGLLGVGVVDGYTYCPGSGGDGAYLDLSNVELTVTAGAGVSVSPSHQDKKYYATEQASVDISLDNRYGIDPTRFYLMVSTDLDNARSGQMGYTSGSGTYTQFASNQYSAGSCSMDFTLSAGGSANFRYTVTFNANTPGGLYHIYVKLSTWFFVWQPSEDYHRSVEVHSCINPNPPQPPGPPPPPGCPYLLVWGGSNYVDEGLLNIHANSDIVTSHVISTTPKAVNNRYLLRLTEYPTTISHIDQVKLYATLDDGRIIGLPLVSAIHSDYGNVLPQLLWSDNWRVDELGAKLNNGVSQSIDLKFLAVPLHGRVVSLTFVIEGYNPIVK